MKHSTIALIATGSVLSAGLGYIVYFDYKRRNNPAFRKQLKKERKQAAKASKEAEAAATPKQESKLQFYERVIVECAQESYPDTPEGKESYFMEKVTVAENLIKQGEAYYDEAVLSFYKALKVYPAPMELLTIYQKAVPEAVFQTIVTIVTIEQKAMQGEHTGTPEEAAAQATGIDIE
ncbi:MAS20 protein import receptor-domain-containing protein [Sporodiniella umbellata]|nr:MAS20 protein import receptor-domain-containing protein [Sporodiniella umbellata]